MSSPIASLRSPASSPTASLYVPVHRRTGTSTPSSSRSSSTTRSEPDHAAHTPQPHPLIYSRDALLNLANSPLARISAETRESMRISVPEIVTNRKQRKAIEHSRNQTQNQEQAQNAFAVKPMATRRSRPGRAPERGRRNATKVIDELSWRGRRPVFVPLTPIVI